MKLGATLPSLPALLSSNKWGMGFSVILSELGRGKDRLSNLFDSRISASPPAVNLALTSWSETECVNVNTFQNDFKISSTIVACLKKNKAYSELN